MAWILICNYIDVDSDSNDSDGNDSDGNDNDNDNAGNSHQLFHSKTTLAVLVVLAL